MVNQPYLYPKGYIFSDEPVYNLPLYYNKEEIVETFYYYYDKALKVNVLENSGDFIIIHGEFIHVGVDNQLSESELLSTLLSYYNNNYLEFLNLLDFIAGRYVIIIGNRDNVQIFPDAANTRTTYYITDKNLIASHVYLLNDQYKSEKLDFYKELPELTNGLLMTPFKKIKSIIPNYSLNFFDKTQSRFFPRENNKYSQMSEVERFELVERFWKKQLEFYFSKYENFIFSITGGGDSRFSLALLREHLSKVQFFTYTTIEGEDNSTYAGKILTLDYKIVKQMTEDISLNHKFIYFVENRMQLSENDNISLTKNTIGRHSSFLIPHIKENYNQDKLQHIRGNLLEVAKTRYFTKEFKKSDLNEVEKVYKSQYGKSKNEDAIHFSEESFREFVTDMEYGKQVFDFHLLDLYHWEIRMGRWHPEILNTHDIIFDTVSPFNHRALIEITLSFPYEKRRDEYVFKEIINRNFPILNFYGDNEILNLYEKERNRKYK